VETVGDKLDRPRSDRVDVAGVEVPAGVVRLAIRQRRDPVADQIIGVEEHHVVSAELASSRYSGRVLGPFVPCPHKDMDDGPVLTPRGRKVDLDVLDTFVDDRDVGELVVDDDDLEVSVELSQYLSKRVREQSADPLIVVRVLVMKAIMSRRLDC
jgi:hypothetical protein